MESSLTFFKTNLYMMLKFVFLNFLTISKNPYDDSFLMVNIGKISSSVKLIKLDNFGQHMTTLLGCTTSWMPGCLSAS